MTDGAGEAARQSRRRAPRPTPVIERNVRALVEHAAERERNRTRADRVALAVSRFAGSMNFVYSHLVFLGVLAAGDLGWIPGLPPYDTSFTVLGTVASIEAIFLATFVLIAQNRMSEQEELQNRLGLQASLLTEHEVTHVLRIVAAISDNMGLDAARNPEILDLLRELAPKDMLEKIEQHTETGST
ncbi:MAG TPA: DUF1003 domain-containing protein [Gemmatimonadaceae bacterium]|nr:DUF1003 domain-containing protein [Gemmatimonadaceae bacterium]